MGARGCVVVSRRGVISVDACALWRRAAFLVRQAQLPRNKMDFKCEPSCVFSTGSCSDSVRELECKPAPNKLTMVSSVDAASLFFCNWVSCGCCRWTLSVLSSCSLCAFFCCCSFSKAAKATSCMVAAIPGDPRNGGAYLGTLCYFLTLTMREYCCCTKAMCVPSYTFLLSCPISRTVRRVVASGAARRAAPGTWSRALRCITS